MKKEIVIAIVLGFIIGLVVVFGVITARTALNQRQEAQTPSSSSEPSQKLTPTAAPVTLTVTQPTDGAVFDSDTVVVKGTAVPHATVAITTEKGDFVTTADDTGTFSQEITLISGVNEIEVVSFSSPSGDRSEVLLTVVYSTADF